MRKQKVGLSIFFIIVLSLSIAFAFIPCYPYHFSISDSCLPNSSVKEEAAGLCKASPASKIAYLLPRFEINIEEERYQLSKEYCIALQNEENMSVYFFAEGYRTWKMEENHGYFDKSLGVDLLNLSREKNCEPIFWIDIGQMWLISSDTNEELFACGYLNPDSTEISWMNENEFLSGYLHFHQELDGLAYGIQWKKEDFQWELHRKLLTIFAQIKNNE